MNVLELGESAGKSHSTSGSPEKPASTDHRSESARVPALAALCVVGLVLVGLLVGYEPIGGDPDLMYKPIKAELARALKQGTLPFWSDCFGVGVPLMAESHVAALYPPNWLFYRLLDVRTAYRWLMWLHYVALAGTTFLLARSLQISPWGAAISAISFTLCGFMAIHACNEPFYCVMPYLPLALWLGRRYMATGRRAFQAALGLTIGVQLTLGHFQIQAWTMGLVVLFGLADVFQRRGSVGRFAGLFAAVCWGLAVASAQLGITGELASLAHLKRADVWMVQHALPPAQLAQPVLPRLFIGELRKPPPLLNYWSELQSSVMETSWYVGTIPLILAFVGLTLGRCTQGMRLWKLLIPVCLTLACLPIVAKDLYLYILRVPVLGWFRAPGRYTLVPSLALALLAGSAVDRTIANRQFRTGVLVAVAIGVVGFFGGIAWSRLPAVAASLPAGSIPSSIAMAAITWVIGLILMAGWRRGRLGPAVLFWATSLELAVLFYQAPVGWGWKDLAELDHSPVMRKLKSEPEVALVAGGEPVNLTVLEGIAPSTPCLNLLPPPYHILNPYGLKKPADRPAFDRWGRRFGVTHGIYRNWTKPAAATETVLVTEDPVLEALSSRRFWHPRDATDPRWRLERYSGVFPAVRVLLRARVVDGWPALFVSLSKEDHADEATYLRGGDPPEGSSPRATRANLVSWNGVEAVIEHDGTCDVVFRRAYYPGWQFRVNDGFEQPVFPADGGLQALRLYGVGPSRIRLRYRSAWWLVLAPVSLAATLAALYVIGRPLLQTATRGDPRKNGGQSLAWPGGSR
jgi:hypothetical protein